MPDRKCVASGCTAAALPNRLYCGAHVRKHSSKKAAKKKAAAKKKR